MSGYRFKTAPYKFQLEAFKMSVKAKRFALWLEPGLGKSKVSIDYCSFYHMRGEINKVLIVCPLSVIGVWEEEIAKHCPVPYRTITGPFKAEDKVDVLTYYITAYGYVAYIPPQKKVPAGETPLKREWKHLPEFQALKADCIIVDESHYLIHHNSNRSKAVKKLCRGKNYILQLTGTPQPNNFLDLWNQFDTLVPGLLGNWTDFKQGIAVFDYMGFKPLRWLGDGVKNLRQKIEPYKLRVKKDDALDLPPRTHQKVPVTLEAMQQKVYNKMKKEGYLRLSETEEVTADIVLTQYLRLQQITGGFMTLDSKEIKFAGEAKQWVLEELLPIHTSTGKVIVFCKFLWEIKECLRVSQKVGLKALSLEGSMDKDERDKARVLFQEDSNYKVLIIQVRTGGIGLTLTAASTAIFYSLPYSHAEWVQACDRIHRIGQDKPCLYLYLLGKGTIDEYIYKTLEAKGKLNDLVVNWRRVMND